MAEDLVKFFFVMNPTASSTLMISSSFFVSFHQVIINLDSDEHIFKFLENKFGIGDER